LECTRRATSESPGYSAALGGKSASICMSYHCRSLNASAAVIGSTAGAPDSEETAPKFATDAGTPNTRGMGSPSERDWALPTVAIIKTATLPTTILITFWLTRTTTNHTVIASCSQR